MRAARRTAIPRTSSPWNSTSPVSGDDVADVMDLAGVPAHDGSYVLRPPPPGLEYRTPDREFTELYQLDAGLLHSSHFVRLVKSLPAQLHDDRRDRRQHQRES